jgi:hypothetical protein
MKSPVKSASSSSRSYRHQQHLDDRRAHASEARGFCLGA